MFRIDEDRIKQLRGYGFDLRHPLDIKHDVIPAWTTVVPIDPETGELAWPVVSRTCTIAILSGPLHDPNRGSVITNVNTRALIVALGHALDSE